MTDNPTARRARRATNRDGTDAPTTAASNSADSTTFRVTVVNGMILTVVSAVAADGLSHDQ